MASILMVSPAAVRRYVNKGKLECNITPTGQRVFTKEQIDKFLGVKIEQSSQFKVYYVRASDGSKTLLESQVRLLTAQYGKPDLIVKDKASGLNDKRRGLLKLIKLSQQNKITDIYMTHPDRLTRFGFNYLKELFTQNNVILHTLDDSSHSPQEELLADFMSLIASFSGKFYRLRGFAQQSKLLTRAQEEINDKKAH